MSKKPMSFSEMRKQSSNLEAIQSKMKKGSSKNDDRFWRAELDKAGNAEAVIRFLPAPEGESEAFVEVLSFAFQENGKWFINPSPATIGQPCPVSEENNKLWSKGDEESIALARSRGRRKSYFSNIYIVKDPANPENEGKVFLFRYGPALFQKIEKSICPEFESDEPVIPFDLWNGANFKLRIGRKGGYANYDSSAFEAPKKLLEDDAELEKVWKSQYSLQEFVDPSKFKSYDELKTMFLNVIGGETVESKTIEDDLNEDSLDEDDLDSLLEDSNDSDDSEDLDSMDVDLSEDDEDLDELRKLVS